MGSHIFGKNFCMATFGESHGPAMGVVIDGCPSGVPFSEPLLREYLKRRRPGFSDLVSQRKEPDEPEVLSGVFCGKTLGTPLAVIVRNKDQSSKEYDEIKERSRVGHADDLWKAKFTNCDHRGGGRASGRETLSRVIGGAIAKMFITELYPSISIDSFVCQVGSIQRSEKDPKDKEVRALLLKAQKEGQSYGGIVAVSIKNCPPFLGEPVFKKLKSELASAMMSVGGTQSVELGFGAFLEEGTRFHNRPDSPHYGGMRGGISTGEEVCLRVSFKPTASILDTAKKGRHDPCVALRAAVVLEAMSYLVLADLILARRLNNLVMK